MTLYLVGETIDKARAHRQAGTGKLVQLVRGIYVDATDDIDASVLKHAVRIAHYLYPNAYLSAASAITLGPTPDGRLFITGGRIQRSRLRALEIIQNKAPSQPSLAPATVDDGMGEFRIEVSSMRQRFLEAFRLRSEHATSIENTARVAIAARLVEEYGSPKDAADAVWALARENTWYREGEHAERFLFRNPDMPSVRNEAVLNFIVAWHGQPVGNLSHDGFEWRWRAVAGEQSALVRQTTPGRLPPFIVSLLPEGWLESVLRDKDERAVLRSGKRYMSNIMIVEEISDLAALPPDVLDARLAAYTTAGLFTGTYAGPGRSPIEQDFEQNLARIYARSDTPRLSGIQIKAPMFLDLNGRLSPSAGLPFTHVLKPAGTSGFEYLPIVEWLSLALGKAAGFEAPATALIPMPDGMPPALLIERFDIRKNLEDERRFALEDLCSVLNLPSEAKYDGTIERVAAAIRPLSTAPEQDILVVFKRALFAWLIADGDMHLKNLALLKIMQPYEKQFSSVRIAPLYDAVCTRVFPRLKHDRMALKLNGKDAGLSRTDFLRLASIIGIRVGDAEVAIEEMLSALSRAIEEIQLPALPSHQAESSVTGEKMFDICRAQMKRLSCIL